MHKGPINAFAAARDELSGKFLVWEPLRRGAHSAVFAAHDVRNGTRVTLHLVLRSALARAMITDQYRQAIADAAALDHPGIVKVVASGTTTSFDWFATRQLDPETQLSALIRERGPLDGGTLVHVIQKTSEILAFAHRAGVVHGHLSPANIYLDHDRTVRVSDFATRRVLHLLAPANAQPDSQFQTPGNESVIDSVKRRDRYSLALIAHECIAGYEIPALTPSAILNAEPGKHAVAIDPYEEIKSRLAARGSIPKPLHDQLNRAAGDPDILPSVAQVAEVLGPVPRIAPDEELPPVLLDTNEERGTVVLYEEPSFVFAAQPEAPKRRWPLLASVAMVTVVTWLALEQFPIGPRQKSADTVIVTRSAVSVDEAALSQRTDSVVAAVRDSLIRSRLADSIAKAAAAERVAANTPVNLPAQKAAPTITVADAGNGAADRRDAAPQPQRATPPRSNTAQQRGASERSASGQSATGSSQSPARNSTRPVPDAAAKAVSAAETTIALPPAPGKLSISTRPWAYLYVDGNLVGNTPASNISLSPGTHTVRVVRDGFLTHERQVTIMPGAQVKLADLVLARINQ